MPTQAQASDPVYQTITCGRIPLSGLTDAEYRLLDILVKKYDAKQDWTRFAAWWNAKFNASGLATASVVYRICNDLEARLGIHQGKVSPPDYRDYLGELIDAQFGSRQEFCRATGIDPGQLSRVLASRDNLSMKVLLQALEVLHGRLVIQTDDEARAGTSIDRAAEAIVAGLRACGKGSDPCAPATSVPPAALAPTAVETGRAVLLDWRSSFPNVRDLEKVAASAQTVAEHKMPLMIADAA